MVFTGPTIYRSSCVFTGPTMRMSYSFLFFFFQIWGLPVPVGGLLVSQVMGKLFARPPIVFASSSIDKHGSQLSTAGIRQQTAAAPTSQQQQHPPANSSSPNRPESISHLETLSPTRLHRVLRSRVNDYGSNWSQTDRLYGYNFIKCWKTSAVSETVCMVETQLCSCVVHQTHSYNVVFVN